MKKYGDEKPLQARCNSSSCSSSASNWHNLYTIFLEKSKFLSEAASHMYENKHRLYQIETSPDVMHLTGCNACVTIVIVAFTSANWEPYSYSHSLRTCTICTGEKCAGRTIYLSQIECEKKGDRKGKRVAQSVTTTVTIRVYVWCYTFNCNTFFSRFIHFLLLLLLSILCSLLVNTKRSASKLQKLSISSE